MQRIPAVSIIVPVFNVEPYLKECLESVINQTFKDIEIICVDNKSEDNSLQILKEYSKKDSRIIIIENDKNYRQGYARNNGIDAAKGDYVFILDSDDYLKLDCLEKMYNKAVKDETDVTICCWAAFDNNTKIVNTKSKYSNYGRIPKELDDKVFTWRDLKNVIFYVSSVAWDKLYKRSFLIEKDIKFPVGTEFEDNIFAKNALFNASKISILRERLLFYRTKRKGSLMGKKNELFFDHIYICDYIEENLKKRNLFEEVKYIFLDYKIHVSVLFLRKIKSKYKKEYFKKMVESFEKIEIKEEEKKFLKPKTLQLFNMALNLPFAAFYILYILGLFFRVEKGFDYLNFVVLNTFEKKIILVNKK